MTRVYERYTLPAIPQSWKYLNRAICQISDSQQPDRIRLRVPLDSGVDGPASRKDVIVHYHSSGGHVPWSVAWQPADGGIYPDFYGKLWIEQDDSNAPVLVLEGAYRPPLGFAGKAFDLVIGARVASITAREFLRAIAAEMQREHAIDEARLRRPASTPEARSA